MAVDMFMKIVGGSNPIGGESKDKVHAGEIDVLAWSWGLSNNGTTHTGAGSGSGKANVQDLSFTKYVDKSTPKIILGSLAGTHFTTATLVVRKAGDKPLEYLTITLSDVLISSVSSGGSGGEDRLTENVTLNFGQLKVAYKEQDSTGGQKGGDITAAWNVAQNAVA